MIDKSNVEDSYKYIDRVIGITDYLIERAPSPEEVKYLSQIKKNMETIRFIDDSLREWGNEMNEEKEGFWQANDDLANENNDLEDKNNDLEDRIEELETLADHLAEENNDIEDERLCLENDVKELEVNVIEWRRNAEYLRCQVKKLEDKIEETSKQECLCVSKIESLVDISNLLERVIEVSDASTDNWYKTFMNTLQSEGYKIIKI